MDEHYRPQILVFFDELETKYGEHFTFDSLKYTELQQLERLAYHAITADNNVSETDKSNLRALLLLVRKQIEYRKRFGVHAHEAMKTG